MLSISAYLSKVVAWNQANYSNNRIFRSDSPFFKGKNLTTVQQNDLGLLLQTLQKHDAHRLHLRCDNWHHTDESFGLFLAVLCFYKHATQNRTSHGEHGMYQTGTVIYQPKKRELRVVTGADDFGIITRSIREEAVNIKGERHSQTASFYTKYEQLSNYIPLSDIFEHSFKRNAPSNLTAYFELFNSTLRHNQPLTKFNQRLLVVAPYLAVQTLPAASQFPIRYNFDRNFSVPLASPLVEVVTRYSDARDEIRKHGNNIDEVVVLGDVGYRQSINDLLNDLDDKYFNRVIILGSRPIHADYKFRSWPWSQTERAWLKKGKQFQIKRISLPSLEIKAMRPLFTDCAMQLVEIGLTTAEANGVINRLVSQHYRDAIIDVPALLDYQSKLFSEPNSIWKSWFEEAGQLISYTPFCQTMMDGLKTLAGHQALNRSKLDKISEIAFRHLSENGRKSQTWVVVRARQADALNAYFSGTTSLKAITYGELKSLLKKPEGNPEQFIFPTLHLNYQAGGVLFHDYSLAQRAAERGPCYVLTYEDLEDGVTNLCEWLYKREEHRRLTHPDRQRWVNFSCASTLPTLTVQPSVDYTFNQLESDEVQNISELLDELELLEEINTNSHDRATAILLQLNDSFTKYFGVWKDIRKKNRRMAVGKQKACEEEVIRSDSFESPKRYLIRFRDDHEYECKESVLLAKVHGSQVVPLKPTSAKKDDLIVRFTISLDICLKALQTIAEAREALKEVKWASQQWRNWLKKSIEYVAFSKNCTTLEARIMRYEKIVRIIQANDSTSEFVQFQRFQQWLDTSEDYIFPRTINHLEIILTTHLNQVVPAEKSAKIQEMKRIMAARHQSASFREVVTKLNTELTRYLITGEKGKLLSHMNEHHIADLLKTRTDRYIQNIQAL